MYRHFLCCLPARPAVGLLLCLSLATTLAEAATQPLPADLAGLWRVADSACNGCDPSQGPETGAEVRFAAHGAQNPFGTDCSATLEVERLPPEPLPSLQARLGLPERWLTGVDPASARSWRLVCAGTAHETLILL